MTEATTPVETSLPETATPWEEFEEELDRGEAAGELPV
jgi:hypothetical protein